MKNRILLGESKHGAINIDIEVLLKTRLLIQANSGGGKSYLLRRLAEQLFGKVPVIIIDPEGEFATLREKFGYVLVGKGGETPADCRSAGMVAHKLLELRASAVCDLYELKPQVRHQWVRLFLEALIDAPKELWRPTVIIVDEAHQYAPEGKAGESEASSGMVDLATRGRKRGYCAVFATQRLGKLRKDAAAELLNVLIGMTFIDIDRERAAESLGVSREEKHKFNDEIKLLTEGHFYGLGRAIAKERTLVKIGSVCTTHPEAGGGKFAAAPPPAPEAIRGMLPKLAELPKQAEEKAKTEADLRTEIRKLKAELSQKPAVAPPQKEVKHFPILTKANEAVLNRTSKAFENIRKLLDDKLIIFPKIADELAQLNKGLPRSHTEDAVNYARAINNARQSVPQRIKVAPARPPGPVIETNNGDWKPTGPEMKVLSVLAQYEDDGVEIGKLALLSCRQVNGTMRNVLASLRSHGCMDGENTAVMRITATGKTYGPFEALPVGDALVDYWRSHKAFGGPERVIFECFLEHPNGLTIDDLAEKTNRQVNGTLRNNLAKLRTAGVLLGKNTETMRLTEDLINV